MQLVDKRCGCSNEAYPAVTFTMTSGRRLPLFRRTMSSFLYRCWDVDLIVRWIVSDDRSPSEELAQMMAEYPWIEFGRSPRPGQPASLNHLFSLVETDWFVHWEDDWETIQLGHFIREAFDIAFSDQRIKNVVFRGWDGVWIKDGDLEFHGHVFCQGIKEPRWKENDFCWFGYSLNPSLQHLPTVRALGPYDEAATNRFFDRPNAERYREMGLLRANSPIKYVEHIGENNPAWEGYE